VEEAVAKTAGLGDNFYIGGYDLSGDVASLERISGGPALIDVTAINQSASSRIGGLRDGDMQFTTHFNNSPAASTPSVPASTVAQANQYANAVLVTITGGTMTNVSVNGSTVGTGAGTYVLPALGSITMTYTVAPTWAWTAVGGEHNVLSVLPRADEIASYLRGTALGNPAACVNGKQINYDPTRANTGALTTKVEVQASGFGLEWGIQVTAGLRTDTTATTGAAYDLGAGSTFGAQAYLQLVEFAGTSVDVKVTHATTSGGSYTTLIDFGALTAIGAVRGSAAGTVNEFLKITTTGTFTYAVFSVVFMQNQSAVAF
jgi:hypothetical protein